MKSQAKLYTHTHTHTHTRTHTPYLNDQANEERAAVKILSLTWYGTGWQKKLRLKIQAPVSALAHVKLVWVPGSSRGPVETPIHGSYPQRFQFCRFEGPRSHISGKFPGEASAAGPQTTLWEPFL
jgi:hypothetical protein